MKKISLIILLCLSAIVCKGQSETEVERRDKLVKECNCPNQVINTDSVYSFFRSEPWKPIKKGNGFFVIHDEPIPFDTIFTQATMLYFFDELRGYYEDHVPFRKEIIIPPATLRKMLAKMFDSTTRYTPAIEKWNTATMGEQWTTQSNYSYTYQLMAKKLKEKKGEKYEQFAKIMSDLNYSKNEYAMSIPVFDDDYNYAFLILKKSSYSLTFALFKKNGKGWEPILVFIPKDRFGFSHMKYDFREF